MPSIPSTAQHPCLRAASPRSSCLWPRPCSAPSCTAGPSPCCDRLALAAGHCHQAAQCDRRRQAAQAHPPRCQPRRPCLPAGSTGGWTCRTATRRSGSARLQVRGQQWEVSAWVCVLHEWCSASHAGQACGSSSCRLRACADGCACCWRVTMLSHMLSHMLARVAARRWRAPSGTAARVPACPLPAAVLPCWLCIF
jgi:hypothetical protein